MDQVVLPVEAPALAIDTHLCSRYSATLTRADHSARRITANLIAHLGNRGFQLLGVDDGEDFEQVQTTQEAMELVFNLEEAHLRFQKPDYRPHWVLLVPSNGTDIITDWNFAVTDPDGFDAAMMAFNGEDFA